MNVTLRQRKKKNNISLYLDYYDKGTRKLEYLNLYLHPTPVKGRLGLREKNENAETLNLAEKIRAKRFLEIQNGIYGFQDQAKMKGSFIVYVKFLAEQRNSSQGNYGNWDSALKHLKKYSPQDVTFAQIDKKWLEGLKEYFKTAKTPSKKILSQNSQCSYFNKIRAALKQALKDDIIIKNPASQIDGVKQGDTEREFLTLEELQAVVKTPCENKILKDAFLFSCLTGLRWSDINKLLWSEICYSNELNFYIRFKQKKTGSAETLPISEQAYKLLGEKGKPSERVFVGLKYSSHSNFLLQKWMMKAGISKTITFHCARHSYATLQLTMGTDIFTVSKMLGHKELKTTQIYAKVIDAKKMEAANKILIDL